MSWDEKGVRYMITEEGADNIRERERKKEKKKERGRKRETKRERERESNRERKREREKERESEREREREREKEREREREISTSHTFGPLIQNSPSSPTPTAFPLSTLTTLHSRLCTRQPALPYFHPCPGET